MNEEVWERKDWRGAIVGMVMGDASLYKTSEASNYQMSIAHSIKQEEYLRHKVNIVQKVFEYELPIRHELNNAGNGKLYPSVKMQTRVNPRFKFIANNIYINKKKRITPWVLDNITTEGLAYWWMDDGCLALDKRPGHGGGQVILATHAFPLYDVELLRDWIADKYGCQLNIREQHNKGGWYLKRGISESKKLLDELAPYAVPCMSHKFDYAKSIERTGGGYNLTNKLIKTAPDILIG